METRYLQISMSFLKAFYPTYEEWKRNSFILFFVSKIAFYPTYEEWKQLLIVLT